ncbi:MAG: glycine zipper family protein [Rhodocyclaceae bacterium]|jgi:hypothetical protein|nr:glycine zipper family protein [Rhodocyclaceae bacterium]
MRSGVRISLAAAALLAGCASVPTGPDVMVLPGTGKSFDEFRTDDMVCRDFAYRQVGGKAGEEAATSAAVRNAAIGTAVGAVAGAVIGGRDAAGVGAGTGLIIGSVSGAEASRGGIYGNQRRYDNAYVQCMYAKGHRVPVSGHYTPAAPLNPPPPPGSPPPPPVR